MTTGRSACTLAVAVSAAALAITALDFAVWAALLIAPVLVLGSLPLLVSLHRKDPDRRVLRLVILALVLKLLASMARYYVAFGLYDGLADAAGYHERGTRIAEQLLSPEAVDVVAQVPGTGFIELLTGLLYALTGPTIFGAFLVFSWLGFWGLYLCYRAFTVAVPEGDRVRYAALVLLLPSLLFWPSSVGKESWMVLGIGAAAFGAALLYRRRLVGLLPLALGLLATGLVRPHVTLILSVAVVVGAVATSSRAGQSGGLVKVAIVGVLVVATAVALTQAETFLGVDREEGKTVGDVVEEVQRNTSQGGSSFEANAASNPVLLPLAVVTVLFRPFPFEAGNVQALATSLEGLALMGLLFAARGRLRSLPRLLARSPYVTFCVTYSLLFCIAFSTFNNFGILTRQRVQVFPFVLVLLALPLVRRTAHGEPILAAATALDVSARGRDRRAALLRRQSVRNHSTV